MLQEKLTSPQALPVSKQTRLTIEAPGTTPPFAVLAQDQPQVICPPRSQSALRLRGGLKPRQRAPSVYRAWSKGHQNQRPLFISTHLLATRPTIAQLMLLISFTYSYANYPIYLTASTAPYRTAQLSIYMAFSKGRQHSPERFNQLHLRWITRDQHPALGKQLSQPRLPRRVCPSKQSSLLFSNWQHQTGNKDQTQVLTTAAVGSECSWHHTCPSLTAGNGTRHRYFAAWQIFLRKRKQTNPEITARAEPSQMLKPAFSHWISDCMQTRNGTRKPQPVWIFSQHEKHKHFSKQLSCSYHRKFLLHFKWRNLSLGFFLQRHAWL